MYDSQKKFKGFAYLDLESSDSDSTEDAIGKETVSLKQKCLTLDRVEFMGRPVYISEYQPKAKRNLTAVDDVQAKEGDSKEEDSKKRQKATVEENNNSKPDAFLFKPSFIRAKPKRKLALN